MIKRDELTNPMSCFNKALPDECIFVLLARDPASPAAIRAWAHERVRRGKNKSEDPQIKEALTAADHMEKQFHSITIIADRKEKGL